MYNQNNVKSEDVWTLGSVFLQMISKTYWNGVLESVFEAFDDHLVSNIFHIFTVFAHIRHASKIATQFQ